MLTRWPDCIPSARPHNRLVGPTAAHYRLDGPTAAHQPCRLDGPTRFYPKSRLDGPTAFHPHDPTTGSMAQVLPIRTVGSMARSDSIRTADSMARLRSIRTTTLPARWPDCCPSALSARWPDCSYLQYRLDGPTAPMRTSGSPTGPVRTADSMAPLLSVRFPGSMARLFPSGLPARWPDCSHPLSRLDGPTSPIRTTGSLARLRRISTLDGPSASQPHHWLDGPTSFQPHNLLRRQPNCRPLCRRSPPKSAKSRPLLRPNAGGVRETWSAGPRTPSTTQQGRSKTPLRQATKTH